MAVTRTSHTIRLGAPGDAETLENPLAHSRIEGFVLSVGVNPGTVLLNEKADGSGGPLAEAILKSNTSICIPISTWTAGGFKANAGNPAGSVIFVYMEEA